DGARADEKACADLGVREPVAGKPRDLRLLGGELVPGFVGALSHCFACRQQLATRARRKRLSAHRGERIPGGAELVASVNSPSVPSEPFAVEKVSTGQLERHASAREAVD